MSQTRQKLLENFDDEVREKLKIRDEDAKVYLDRFEQLLMRLTRHELNGSAEFLNVSSFRLKSKPAWADGRAVPLGRSRPRAGMLAPVAGSGPFRHERQRVQSWNTSLPHPQ
jgi:hypothetical protein